MSEIIANEFIRRLRPYKVSERIPSDVGDESVLKLDWNEATRTPSQAVKEAIIAFIDTNELSFYPDLSNKRLIELLAEYASVDTDQLQYFGGSDEGLDYIARTFLSPDDLVISLSPNYDHFRVYVEACGASYVEKFYDAPFSPSISNLLNASLSPKLIYLSNPNNPTGTLLSQENIGAIAFRFPESLIVVDEAYYEFAGESAVPLLSSYPNIVVSRTFSKAFGLAGLRFGYLLANRDILNSINRIRNPKNINIFAQVAAVAALEDIGSMRRYVNEVECNKIEIVRWLKKELKVVRGGSANFIMVQCHEPCEFVNSMLHSGVIVRDRSSMPLLEGYIRITIGGDESHSNLCNALRLSLGLIRNI